MNTQFEVYPATSSLEDDFAPQETYDDPTVTHEHPAVTYEHSDRDVITHEQTAPTVTYEHPTTNYFYEHSTTDPIYEQPSTDYFYEQPSSDYEQVTSEYEHADELTTYPSEQPFQGMRNIKIVYKVPFFIVEHD